MPHPTAQATSAACSRHAANVSVCMLTKQIHGANCGAEARCESMLAGHTYSAPPSARSSPAAAAAAAVATENSLTKNLLSARSADDDLGTHGGHANLDTGVAILAKLAGE
eukprot:353183-Chlamydomonas_euryale.AAC.9